MIIFAGQPVRLRDAQVVESLAARAVDDTLPDWAAEPRRLRMSLELDFDESSNSAVASARAAATDKDARWAVFVMVMVRFHLTAPLNFDALDSRAKRHELLGVTWPDIRAALRNAGHSIDVGVATPMEPPTETDQPG